MVEKMGMIHLYTGNGGGKTTAALGVALRALGHKKKVVVIQFMKGRETGEAKIKLKNYKIYQFGRKEFVDFKKPDKKDYELAEKGLEKAKEILKKKPDILILDEVNVAVACGLLKAKDVVEVLKRIPKRTTVYLTGRYAPKELIKISDFVTEIIDLKKPKKMVYRKGIEY